MTEAQRSKGTLKATLATLTALATLAGAVLAWFKVSESKPEQAAASITVSPTFNVTGSNAVQVSTAAGDLKPSPSSVPEPNPRAVEAPSVAAPTAGAREALAPVCLGLQPELNVQKATVRFLDEKHGRHSYSVALVVAASDSSVSVSYTGRAGLTDDSGKMLSDAREGFPSGANIPLRKSEALFNLGLKVEPGIPQVLSYRFVRASHRGKTASFGGNLVIAKKLADGNFTAIARTVSCENLPVE